MRFVALGKIISTAEVQPRLSQKVVRMRLVLVLLLASTQLSFAQSEDPSNGNLIPEPNLSDYDHATRTPGIMSEPYDIVDENGNLAQVERAPGFSAPYEVIDANGNATSF